MPKERRKKDRRTSPYFRTMVDHIDSSWMKIKGFHYPFNGKDFSDLKHFCASFQEWGVMALWDAFVNSDNDWVKKSGFSLSAFFRCLPWLVDVPGWKEKAATYEKTILPMVSEEITDLFKDFKITVKK